MMENNNMLEEITAQEFRDTGMLLYVNQMLQPFGLSLVVDMEKNELYAAKSKFRGFDGKSIDRGYRQINNYLKDNIEEITDCFDEGEQY